MRPKTDESVVLVVDDDPDIRDLLRRFLEENLCLASVGARDGAEAISWAKVHRPRLVLLDMVMPRVGGIEVARWLKANPATSGVPVIAVSADRTHRSAAIAAGCADYVDKPFELARLRQALDRHLASA